MHPDLAAFESPAEIGFKSKYFSRGIMHPLVKYLVPGLSGPLRLVHRSIGVAHYVFCSKVFFGGVQDPDARRAVDLVPVKIEREGKLFLNAACNPVNLGLVVSTLDKYGKLVTAK